ncbi:MAG: glycoside hydrolase family 16 protein [Kiritimatiellae bacterium]|nr:glycoside hydrolase family 16 protein [Kiritimatiellia bacterium]
MKRICRLLASLLILSIAGCEDDSNDAPVIPNLIDAATVCPSTVQGPRMITFAGRTWEVRQAASPAAAGENCWTGDARNAWVDSQGRLHLRITRRSDVWTCTEIYSSDSYGYGTYTFRVASPVGAMDRNVVLGLFTWDNDAPRSGRLHEIDIEFTPWSRVFGENLHYSVQPVMGPDTDNGQYDERTDGVFLPGNIDMSVHRFTWMPSYVDFASMEGPTEAGELIHSWRFTADNPARRSNDTTLATPVLIPTPSRGTSLRINLWLNDGDSDGFGDAPADGREVEVVIDQFTYTPA